MAVTASLLLAVSGCHRSTWNLSSSPRNVGPQMREVSGRTFELEYGAPRTPNSQWRYRGLEGDYHVMDYYGLGRVYDQPEYRYSIRTRKDNLPKGFPTQPQPPVKTTISKDDEKYFDMMQEEERREKIRSGDTGINW
jgi:hypothetical protein